MTTQLGFGFDAPPVPAATELPAVSGIDRAPTTQGPGVRSGGSPPRPSERDANVSEGVTSRERPATAFVFHDGICDVALANSRNMLVPWYLIACWSYFVGDHPLLTDARFDRLCRELDAEWDRIEHRDKSLIDRALLKAGTCGLARDSYPPSVRGAAAHLAAAAGVRIPRD